MEDMKYEINLLVIFLCVYIFTDGAKLGIIQTHTGFFVCNLTNSSCFFVWEVDRYVRYGYAFRVSRDKSKLTSHAYL